MILSEFNKTQMIRSIVHFIADLKGICISATTANLLSGHGPGHGQNRNVLCSNLVTSAHDLLRRFIYYHSTLAQRTEGRINLNFQAHQYGVAFLSP